MISNSWCLKAAKDSGTIQKGDCHPIMMSKIMAQVLLWHSGSQRVVRGPSGILKTLPREAHQVRAGVTTFGWLVPSSLSFSNKYAVAFSRGLILCGDFISLTANGMCAYIFCVVKIFQF